MEDLASKEIKALWYAWQRPDLGRHEATIERANDPIVTQAYNAIQGGNPTLAEAAVQGGAVADLLDRVFAYSPPKRLLSSFEQRQQMTAGELAGDFWPERETVMTLPAQPYFTGELPPPEQGHTCKSSAKAIADGDGVVIVKKTAKLWRARMIGGLYMSRCETCYHERVWRLCNQVIQEAELYPSNDVPLRVVTLSSQKQLTKVKNKARQWRVRDEIDFRYAAFPQAGGGVVLIHNLPDKLEGDPLPHDKGELYAMMRQWADVPEGKRTQKSNGWGGKFQGNKGDGRKRAGAAEEEKAVLKPVERIELEISSFGKLAMHLDQAYGIKLRGRGRYDLGIVDLVDLCDAAGVAYAVNKGADLLDSLRAVTTSVHKETLEKECTEVVTHKTAPPPEPMPFIGVLSVEGGGWTQ